MKDTVGHLRRTITLLLAAAVVTGLASACSIDLRDHICNEHEYPTATIGYEGGNGSCVPDGKQPPKGEVRFPNGEVPQRVDDKWDKYWQKHALDRDGKLVTDPNEIRH